MTQRERILASLVGAMLLVMFLIYLVNRLQGQFERRNDQVQQMEQDVARQQRILQQGSRAAKQLEEYAERSLPSDRALARSLYQEWLLERAVKSGFSGVNVSPVPGRPHGDVFYQHAFLVNGQGDLRELTQFLYQLQSVGFLHRVSRLTAKPVVKSKDLDLSITIDALSLNSAPADKKLDRPPSRTMTHGDMAHYVDTIVARNFFGPANKPPRFSSLNTQTGHPGQPVRVGLRASDPDGDRLTYEFASQPLPGAKLDKSSGQFEWTPEKLGEYEVAVRVTDNGLPPKSDKATFKINVVNPPPPPPAPIAFDPAKQSVVTGITEIDGKRLLWVTVRTEGRVLQLQEGDELAVGSIRGTVSRIEASHVEIKTEKGQTLSVALGKSLLASEAPPAANL